MNGRVCHSLWVRGLELVVGFFRSVSSTLHELTVFFASLLIGVLYPFLATDIRNVIGMFGFGFPVFHNRRVVPDFGVDKSTSDIVAFARAYRPMIGCYPT